MMIVIYLFYGLLFSGLGLTAFLQYRRGGDFPLRKQLPWLAAFGLTYGTTGWIEMFLASGVSHEIDEFLSITRIILQPISGLLLLVFGWNILTKLEPLPSWTIILPGLFIVPIAYVVSYAATTFITPSPIEIPIDIWSRYLLYLPGSIMAGIGFLRQWRTQGQLGYNDVSNLMLGAGVAFLFEAFVVGLVVPAAPYGPASYYNYNRALSNAFIGEQTDIQTSYGLTAWLDYQRVLEITGLPIQFWRLVSAIAVTSFVIRGLDVFDAIRKRELRDMQKERDKAQKSAFEAQHLALKTAEGWTHALVSISRRVADLEDVDNILLYIVESTRKLLKSDFMGIGLLNDQYTHLELKCYSTEQSTEITNSPILIKNPYLLNIVLSSQSYYSVRNEPHEKFENICISEDIKVNQVVIVPLSLDSTKIGALWIARCSKRSRKDIYSKTDLIWLECLADQVMIAIKHGLMTAQLQSLSVIEERTRIAREMHDGLAQILGYLNMQVQTLEALFNQGKMESLLTELQNMRHSIQLAHADVRENILSLRTTLTHEKGVIPAIAEYLEEFSIQTNIDVLFENFIGNELNISSFAEVQVVCILQEALANVRKHANAKNVKVTLTKEMHHNEETIKLSILDDGIGFILSDSKRSFGLQTMRERAQSVKGTITIHSRVQEGTSVDCKLPSLYHEGFEKETTLIDNILIN